MYPNKLGEIIAEEWEFTREIKKNVKLHEYVVMPNHFHALVEICYSENKSNVPGEYKAPSQTLSAIVRGFKGAVTSKNKSLKLGNENGVWHSSFNDQVIRDEQHLITLRTILLTMLKTGSIDNVFSPSQQKT